MQGDISESFRGRKSLYSLSFFTTYFHHYPLIYTQSKCLKEYEQEGYHFVSYRQKNDRFLRKNSQRKLRTSTEFTAIYIFRHSILLLAHETNQSFFGWFPIETSEMAPAASPASHPAIEQALSQLLALGVVWSILEYSYMRIILIWGWL